LGQWKGKLSIALLLVWTREYRCGDTKPPLSFSASSS